MTPQLKVAIAAIQPLSPTERQQLLQILIQADSSSNSQTDLKMLSDQFCQGIALRRLAPIKRGSKAVDLLKFAGTWQGNDLEECFHLVHETRSKAQF